jgi:hypothetical protein
VRRMTLRLQLYRSVTGRWRRGTNKVHVLEQPLELRDDLRDWSRRVIFALSVLLALCVVLVVLVTRDCVIPAVRSFAAAPVEPPSSFCTRSPFALYEELFVCAPAGAEPPSWSTPITPVEHRVPAYTLRHPHVELRRRSRGAHPFGAGRLRSPPGVERTGSPGAAWTTWSRLDSATAHRSLAGFATTLNHQLDNLVEEGPICIYTGLGGGNCPGQRTSLARCLHRPGR